MPLTIRVELLRGVYEAADAVDDLGAEWPPHPARLFCGLLAGADGEEDMSLLRWLESQPPPVVIAADVWEDDNRRPSYVPSNQIQRKASAYQHFPARKALGPRTWRHVAPRSPVVGYQWDAEPSAGQLRGFRDLTARLGYLGRSTSPVVADLVESLESGLPRWTVDDRPDPMPVGTTLLTVPEPGYLDALIAAFEADEQPWAVPRRSVRYAPESNVSGRDSVPTSRGPYGELIVLPFRGRRISSAFTLTVTSTFRKAIESRLDGGPLVLRGRRRGEEGPRHQIAVLGLPFVGTQYATGDLLGVGLALPAGLADADRRMIFEALAHTTELTLGRLGVVALEHGISSRETLRPATWVRPSRSWVTATPLSSDRHHRRLSPDVLEDDVRRACEHADLPSPVDIEVSRLPLTAGAQTIRPNLRVRHRGDRATASFHARITFADLIEGPVVLGNLRHYGLGLMRPER